MLRNVHSKAVVDERSRQIGMAIKEETVGDKESRRIGNRLPSKLDDLNQIGIRFECLGVLL